VTQRVVGKTNENRCVSADQLYINEKLYFQPSPQFDNFTPATAISIPYYVDLVAWLGAADAGRWRLGEHRFDMTNNVD